MVVSSREAKVEYREFCRPPYAGDPLDEQRVRQASLRGVACRLLIDPCVLDEQRRRRFEEFTAAGVQVRQIAPLPLKLSLFDGCRGLIALLDPVITKPAWTSLAFDHPGLGEAMRYLFEERWRQAVTL